MELHWRSNPMGKVRNNLPFYKKSCLKWPLFTKPGHVPLSLLQAVRQQHYFRVGFPGVDGTRANNRICNWRYNKSNCLFKKTTPCLEGYGGAVVNGRILLPDDIAVSVYLHHCLRGHCHPIGNYQQCWNGYSRHDRSAHRMAD